MTYNVKEKDIQVHLGVPLYYLKHKRASFLSPAENSIAELIFVYGNNSTWYAIDADNKGVNSQGLLNIAKEINYDHDKMQSSSSFLKTLREEGVRFKAKNIQNGETKEFNPVFPSVKYTFYSDERSVAEQMLEVLNQSSIEHEKLIKESKDVLDSLQLDDLKIVRDILQKLKDGNSEVRESLKSIK